MEYPHSTVNGSPIVLDFTYFSDSSRSQYHFQGLNRQSNTRESFDRLRAVFSSLNKLA